MAAATPRFPCGRGGGASLRSRHSDDPCGRDRQTNGGAEGATGPGNSQANGPQGDWVSGKWRLRLPTDEVRLSDEPNLSGLRTEGVATGAVFALATLLEICLSELKHTPLYTLHRELGARLVPFAGYEMPVQYPTGILAEHAHTRSAAGLFDVSHMGQVRLTAKPGHNAARALETLVPGDIAGLQPGQQRYTQFTNETGGIPAHLMVPPTG